MPWYRPRTLWSMLAPYVLGALALTVFASGVWYAVREYGLRRYEEGRASLVRESAQWLAASNGAWSRVAAARHDTVRVLDTVLVTRIVRARETVATIQDSLQVRAAVQDSARSLYDTTLRACGVQLDSLATECDRFRVAATAALAAKDSAAARDSVRLRAAALDAASYKQQALDMWRKLEDDAVKRRATRWLYVLAGAALTWGVMR